MSDELWSLPSMFLFVLIIVIFVMQLLTYLKTRDIHHELEVSG